MATGVEGMTAAEAAEIASSDGKTEATGTVTLPISNRVVVVHSCRTRHIAAISELICLVFEELGIEDIQEGMNLSSITPAQILKLISKLSEKFIPVLASLSDLTEEEVADLELDDLLELIAAVWQKNERFFLRTLPSLLK